MAAETSKDPKDSKKDPLPPGMVLGPDGKPCKICTSSATFRQWKQLAAKQESQSSSKPAGAAVATAAAGAAAVAAATTTSGSDSAASSWKRPDDCPPDVEQLGRATWTFLHTTAAYYPERPTPVQRSNMLSLLRSLPILYPCSWCASHLEENIKDHPPDVSGRLALSRWLCERHNDVNERLGKPRFDCAKTDERWKDGPPDGSCD